MEKKTKTILLAGAGILVLGGAGWWFFGRRRYGFFDPAKAQQRLRESLRPQAGQLAMMAAGGPGGVRPKFPGRPGGGAPPTSA